MKRIFGLTVVAGVIALAGVVVWKAQRPSSTVGQAIAPKADSVWYHASDVALLAKTGRPKLVEFFHPG